MNNSTVSHSYILIKYIPKTHSAIDENKYFISRHFWHRCDGIHVKWYWKHTKTEQVKRSKLKPDVHRTTHKLTIFVHSFNVFADVLATFWGITEIRSIICGCFCQHDGFLGNQFFCLTITNSFPRYFKGSWLMHMLLHHFSKVNFLFCFYEGTLCNLYYLGGIIIILKMVFRILCNTTIRRLKPDLVLIIYTDSYSNEANYSILH